MAWLRSVTFCDVHHPSNPSGVARKGPAPELARDSSKLFPWLAPCTPPGAYVVLDSLAPDGLDSPDGFKNWAMLWDRRAFCWRQCPTRLACGRPRRLSSPAKAKVHIEPHQKNMHRSLSLRLRARKLTHKTQDPSSCYVT